jgi:hypothetical protein
MYEIKSHLYYSYNVTYQIRNHTAFSASPLAFATRHHRPRLEPELVSIPSFLSNTSGPPGMTPAVAPSHAHAIHTPVSSRGDIPRLT